MLQCVKKEDGVVNDYKMVTAAIDAIDAVGNKVIPEKICGVVKRHSAIAVGAAFIPVPVASDIACATNIWYMYKCINDELGICFSENKVKTIISGIIANLGTTTLVAVGAGELLKFIPGIGTMAGSALEAAMFAAITYTAAFIYLKAITMMIENDQNDMSEEHLKIQVDKYMSENGDEIDAVFKDAKKSYKNIKQSDGEAARQILQNEAAEDVYTKSAIKFCPSCGRKAVSGAKFCNECGNKLSL